MRLFIVFVLLALPVWAAPENRMSPEAFEEYVTGKTIYYGEVGYPPYGAEEYLSDRRVRWSFLNGECSEGYWYVETDLICFVYENNPDPQCWSFYKEQDGIIAIFENDPSSTKLYELKQADGPLMCPGPEVGV